MVIEVHPFKIKKSRHMHILFLMRLLWHFNINIYSFFPFSIHSSIDCFSSDFNWQLNEVQFLVWLITYASIGMNIGCRHRFIYLCVTKQQLSHPFAILLQISNRKNNRCFYESNLEHNLRNRIFIPW